ncbi:MAG: hypothetical protein HC876_17185, partial [Chloroflexaceae bacterium]|nr:hypothetical protein [Chloroflexaceae bacterium]
MWRAEPLIAHAAAFMQQIGHVVYAKQWADDLTRVRAALAGVRGGTPSPLTPAPTEGRRGSGSGRVMR